MHTFSKRLRQSTVTKCINETRSAKFGMQNSACLTTVCYADWFKCHVQQLYFKADWSEIHFLSTLSFPFYTFVFTSAENMSFFAWFTRAKKCSAAKSDENIIVKGERSIKAAEKEPSTTVVASVHLTGATVVGSINASEFWQRLTQPPSFLLLLGCKMDLAIYLLFTLAAKWFIIMTVFATITFVLATFTDVPYSTGTTSNETEAVP